MAPVIVIATGGSGGHVIPAETLAKKFIDNQCRVEILGHNVEDNPFFSNRVLKRKNIEAAPFNILSIGNFLFKTIKGCFVSYRYLKQIRPDCIVGFGSYHSFPVLCMAFLMKIPFVLYEANTVMGKVIKLFSKKAHFVASPFNFSDKLTNFVQVEPLIKFPYDHVPHSECYQEYGFNIEKKVLLILGGSQGAQFLNTKALEHIIPLLDPTQWQVLHLAGHKSKLDDIYRSYAKYGFDVCVRPYESNMQKAYQISDLVVSRSGANTLFELAHYKKPALLVPFPQAAEDHQLLNADYYVKYYPAAIIEEFLMDKIDVKSVLEKLTSNQNSFKDEAYFINQVTVEQKVLDLCLKK